MGLMKQFVLYLKRVDVFKYLTTKFPAITAEKIKAGVLIGPLKLILSRNEILITDKNIMKFIIILYENKTIYVCRCPAFKNIIDLATFASPS